MNLTYAVPAALLAVTVHATAQLVINEIHHSPDIKTEHVEFIELIITNTSLVNVSEGLLTGGVEFTFANGTVFPAGGHVLVSENPGAFELKFGETAAGPSISRLGGDTSGLKM